VPDIRLAGYPAFFITGIRPDTGYALPDIRYPAEQDIRPDTGYALPDIRYPAEQDIRPDIRPDIKLTY